MKQFIVEITEQSIGSMRVEAETEEEAEDKVQKTLIQYFNHGYSATLCCTAKEVKCK